MVRDPESLVEGAVQVSSLPVIFYQLTEAIEDPETSFADIAQIIGKDSSLSARLLKIVNSSFYGFSSRIETIPHAITIVGMVQLRDLVLATTVVNFFRGLPRKLVNMEAFWYHSIASGLTSRVLAIYRKEPNPERFYVIGLLHDLGRLLLYLNLSQEMKEALLRYERGGFLYEAERDVLGVDHAEVGGALLKKWKLPPRLVEAVRFHHRPSEAPQYPLEASIAHVADIIAHSMELGTSGERYVPSLDARAWDRITLPSSLLSSVLAQVDRQVADAVQTFL